MKRLGLLCMLACFAVPCFAESRAAPRTPKQLHAMSTLVFSGTVLEIETDKKHNVSFPTRAKVACVHKGEMKQSELSFAHKHPSRCVIFEQEFNTPEIGQEGTFYLDKSLTLIGYVNKAQPKDLGDRK